MTLEVGLKEIRDEEDDEEDLDDYYDGPDLISKKDANSCLNSDAKLINISLCQTLLGNHQ